ncbi:transporter substrate-binding domain-containing protein [Streptomyces sp. NBC_01456]|uniref:transporter substrate-binding domain-containing protein n=1 Tax=unclassified Streptomyces TaxID=2593676 RepID=UPI002E31B8FA|nr:MULTISPECIES: transporter substrate-binding domain-containing protein [unclassified Streptomyces]
MKRAAILSALACLLAVSATAPAASGAPARGGDTASPAAGKTSALDAVPRRGVLRVCTTGDYRPFSYRDPRTGSYRGVDIDMARDLAKSLDARPRYVATTWARLVGDLSAGRCDIAMGGVSVTLARARSVYFSAPTRTDGKTPLVRCKDKDKYATLRQIDRPGTRVIVNPGGTNEEFARSHLQHAALTVHRDNTTIFDEIIAGRADVMMTDASETRYQARIHPELCSLHPDKPFTFSEKAYALPRGDNEFKAYVDQWVHLATHDGTYRKYEAAWMTN